MSQYVFLDPACWFPLPPSFDWDEYIEIEREFWALFPETGGRRAYLLQGGLTAQIYAEVTDDGSELAADETYILMPNPDRTIRPIRMAACRRLTLGEYRMGHLTSIKLLDCMTEAGPVMRQVGNCILGDEVMQEVEFRLRESEEEE